MDSDPVWKVLKGSLQIKNKTKCFESGSSYRFGVINPRTVTDCDDWTSCSWTPLLMMETDCCNLPVLLMLQFVFYAFAWLEAFLFFLSEYRHW